MRLNWLKNCYGILSLVWISGIFGVLLLLGHLKAEFPDISALVGGLLYIIVWWGIGLLFAISGVRAGHPVSRVCAVISILAFGAFVQLLVPPPIELV